MRPPACERAQGVGGGHTQAFTQPKPRLRSPPKSSLRCRHRSEGASRDCRPRPSPSLGVSPLPLWAARGPGKPSLHSSPPGRQQNRVVVDASGFGAGIVPALVTRTIRRVLSCQVLPLYLFVSELAPSPRPFPLPPPWPRPLSFTCIKFRSCFSASCLDLPNLPVPTLNFPKT